jgi:hypothetical protein
MCDQNFHSSLFPFISFVRFSLFFIHLHAEDDGPWTVQNVWALLVFLRLYLFARVISNQSFSAGARLLGMWSNFEFTPSFMVRSFLDGSLSVRFLSFVFFWFLAVTSYCLHVCERSIGGSRDSLLGAMWLIATTIPRVGYGSLLLAHIFDFVFCGT